MHDEDQKDDMNVSLNSDDDAGVAQLQTNMADPRVAEDAAFKKPSNMIGKPFDFKDEGSKNFIANSSINNINSSFQHGHDSFRNNAANGPGSSQNLNRAGAGERLEHAQNYGPMPHSGSQAAYQGQSHNN